MEQQCQCATASASKKESKKRIHGKKDEAAERREHDKNGDVNEDAKGEVPLLSRMVVYRAARFLKRVMRKQACKN